MVQPQNSSIISTSDDIYTISELIKRRAQELENSPLIGYPRDGLIDYEEHSAHALDLYTNAAAEALQQRGLRKVSTDLEKSPVVGILAHSGLDMILTILGLSRLGYAVLLLSTRLATPAIIRLLDLAPCNSLLTTSNFHSILSEIQQERNLKILELLTRSDYYCLDAPAISRTYDQEKENQKVAIVIHSSGSTGLPKPIYLTHRSCIAAFGTNLDMRALCTSPLFHSQGFYETFRSIYSGKPIYYCNYSLPLTKQNLIDMIDYVKPDLLHCVPYVLKLLAESPEGVRSLAKVALVLFGGSACPDDLGDRLVKNGVNLVANYGATETGRLMNSVRPPGDHAWNYLRMLPAVKSYVLMDEIGPNVYECVALDGLKSKSTVNSDNPPRSFRTRDLFARHPTRPNLWKYLSRLDDRLTLTLGEKVLPIPIESHIRQETIVKEAVVFGEGKSVPGILIIKADTAEDMEDHDYLDTLWSTVEDANSRAEAFSRIPKELVILLPSDTIYPRTDKGTFIRAQVYEQFKKEIENAYTEFSHGKGGSLMLSQDELECYLREQFLINLGVELPSIDTDFFSFGIDSLQCIKMWNFMKKTLDLGEHQAELGQNVLYETGSLKALVRHLDRLRTGRSVGEKDEYQVMKDMIAKYSKFDPVVRRDAQRPLKEGVLLTGVTGGLGAHLLAQIVTRPSVSTVYALVRASSDAHALRRVHHSLKARGIRLEPDQQDKIVALASDLSKVDFELASSQLEALRSRLTLVVHSAWAVNFNIPVTSFEDQHIRAVHNLIQLCRSAPFAEPARFFFCSSVSAAGGTPRPGSVAECPVQNILHVQGTGYARSKYVAEQITINAMRSAGLESRVLRVGQLVGDSKVGEWNITEGIPLMIQTAETLGSLPALDEEMSWLPVDYAASIILDIVQVMDPNTGNQPYQSNPETGAEIVYHVLNPVRFHWTRQMLPALRTSGLKFKTLSTDQWMELLRASPRDPKRNPPIKLLDWFESKYGCKANPNNRGGLVYLTEKTKKVSRTVECVLDVTSVEFVKKIVKRLRIHWGNDKSEA